MITTTKNPLHEGRPVLIYSAHHGVIDARIVHVQFYDPQDASSELDNPAILTRFLGAGPARIATLAYADELGRDVQFVALQPAQGIWIHENRWIDLQGRELQIGAAYPD